jgi:hypothetical protein
MPVAWRARALKYVPDPLRASRNPSRFKSLIARRTVIRETPNFRISMLSLGILPSALYLPWMGMSNWAPMPPMKLHSSFSAVR